jgi:PIN domain nuclease of toxin-antitoxin system
VSAPLLDTHAWLWWVGHDSRLGRLALEGLDALPAGDRPCLSDISLWEVAMLAEQQRITLIPSIAGWLEAAAHPKSVRIVPITAAIAAETATLPASFHRDPADRVIVATSRVLQIPLCTRDRLILRSKLVTRWIPGH